jgi:hypothetical protein
MCFKTKVNYFTIKTLFLYYFHLLHVLLDFKQFSIFGK